VKNHLFQTLRSNSTEAQLWQEGKIPAGSWFDQASLSLLAFLLEREKENTW